MPILKTPDSHLDDELAPLLPKLDKLMEHIRSLGPVGLGFSGGVDSTFLAAVCARCASDRVVLFHLDTPFIGTPEQRAFEHSLDMLGLPVVRVALDPLLDERIVRNDGNRCYHCKLLGFRAIEQAARERGIETLLEGSNADDDETLRPGSRATRELGVCSPLRDLGWHKDEERAVLRAWGFAVWNLPAGACLATRVATGERLTPAALDIIRRCEDELGARGYRQVRLRIRAGRSHVAASAQDLERLRATGGADTADGVELEPELFERLCALGAPNLERSVRPYRYGA